MQKTTLGAALLGGAALAIVLLWRSGTSPATEAPEAPVEATGAGVGESASSAPARRASAEPAGAARAGASRDSALATADHDAIPREEFAGESERDLVLVAQTPEEAAWLSQRGYPKLSDWRARAAISMQDLGARVAAGDLAASAMLAERLAEQGDYRRARDLIEEATIRGSVFAPIVMAKIDNDRLLAKPQKSPMGFAINQDRGDVLLSIQYASLMGDYRAADVIRSLNIPRQDYASISSAIRTAHWALAQRNRERAARGLAPLVPVTRPGALTWSDARLNNPPAPIVSWRGWR